MKAAIMFPGENLPRYLDVTEPAADNEEEVLVTVKAAALKHLDKGRATGAHYSADAPPTGGRIIGADGVCLLPDGRRVYGIGVEGMMAEKALIYRRRMVPLPANLSDADAAALGNAVIGSAMGLRFKAQIKRGDTVLVNGATGFTGRVAVQIARYYGAGRVIATGRNAQSLEELLTLGADEVLHLRQPDEVIAARLKTSAVNNPIDVVIDYLWGHSAELILASLRGRGHFTNQTRFVSVGSMSGDAIALSAATLRSVNLQLSGSGLGAWSEEEVNCLFSEILPEMFRLAADGKLTVKITEVKLENIARLWETTVPDGQRLVVII